MTPGLRHELAADGSVVLTLTATNGKTLSVGVSANHAKAKAWGMLADLDPEGAEGVDQAEFVIDHAKDPALRPSLRIMIAVERGPAASQRIAQLTGLAPNQIASQLKSHVLRGRLSVDSSTRGQPGVYDLTHAGFKWLNTRRPT
jgi:predicted Rossmann fold nucleotide-binding protein DprA/Smf involved in DNA uptake